MDFGCGCLGMTVIGAVLLIIAGLMNDFVRGAHKATAVTR